MLKVCFTPLQMLKYSMSEIHSYFQDRQYIIKPLYFSNNRCLEVLGGNYITETPDK